MKRTFQSGPSAKETSTSPFGSPAGIVPKPLIAGPGGFQPMIIQNPQQQKVSAVPPPIKFVKASDGAAVSSNFSNVKMDTQPSNSTTTVQVSSISNPDELELANLQKLAAESMEESDASKNSAVSASSKETIRSPMMILNERIPGFSKSNAVTFETKDVKVDSAQGPTLKPYFVCRAKLMDREFIGEGWTKKEAKQAMAQKVVDALPSAETNPETKMEVDQWQHKLRTKPAESDEISIQRIAASAQIKGKSPMQVLNELVARLSWGKPATDYKDVSPEGSKPHEFKFVCILTLTVPNESASVGGGSEQKITYESDPANSKKVALQDVAKKALSSRFGMDVHMFDDIDSTRLTKLARHKDPFQALNEVCLRKGLKIIEETPTKTDHSRPFQSILKIGDHSIEGESYNSKRDAKRVAAIKAAKEIFGVDIAEETAIPFQPVPSETAACPQEYHDAARRPSAPPVDALQHIAAVAGVTVVYENVSETPNFGVKLVFGKSESTGFGHTRDEAKSNAAVGILQQMGLGEYLGYGTPEQEAGGEAETMDAEGVLSYSYCGAQGEYEWGQGGEFSENYEDPYWQGTPYQFGMPPGYGYQYQQPIGYPTRGKNVRGRSHIQRHFMRRF